MVVDFGKRILALMAERGIKTAKQLTDLITEEARSAGVIPASAGEKLVTANSVGRWISGTTQPKATGLMFLAKALKVSADVILFGDEISKDPKLAKVFEKMIADLVQKEVQKATVLDGGETASTVNKFLISDKIPEADRGLILAQIKRLIERYHKEI